MHIYRTGGRERFALACLFSGLQSDRELLGSTEARSSFQKSPAYKFG